MRRVSQVGDVFMLASAVAAAAPAPRSCLPPVLYSCPTSSLGLLHFLYYLLLLDLIKLLDLGTPLIVFQILYM